MQHGWPDNQSSVRSSSAKSYWFSQWQRWYSVHFENVLIEIHSQKYWLRFHPQGVHHKLGESFQMILHFQFKVLTVWERTQGRLTHHFSCYMEKSSLQRAFFSEASFSVVRNCQYSLDRGTKLAVKKNVYLNVSIWIDIIQVASGTAGLLFENTYTQAHTVL